MMWHFLFSTILFNLRISYRMFSFSFTKLRLIKRLVEPGLWSPTNLGRCLGFGTTALTLLSRIVLPDSAINLCRLVARLYLPTWIEQLPRGRQRWFHSLIWNIFCPSGRKLGHSTCCRTPFKRLNWDFQNYLIFWLLSKSTVNIFAPVVEVLRLELRHLRSQAVEWIMKRLTIKQRRDAGRSAVVLFARQVSLSVFHFKARIDWWLSCNRGAVKEVLDVLMVFIGLEVRIRGSFSSACDRQLFFGLDLQPIKATFRLCLVEVLLQVGVFRLLVENLWLYCVQICTTREFSLFFNENSF